MANYYVNNRRQESANNNNEVHKEGCPWLAKATDTTYLGDFISCRGAVEAAKRKYPSTADGCKTCCPDCHRG